MPRTRSGNTGHRQCKDEATGMSETIRPGKSNHGQSSTTDEATRKMLRPSKPYLDQCKDEATAIRESIRLLREIEVRSRRAAILCYKTSSTNECLYILFAVIKVMVVAVVGIMTHKYLSKTIEGKVSSAEYKIFINECIEKREEICIKARPDEKIYKEYEKLTTMYDRDENSHVG
ncbi:uncharacterized protein LOC125374503 [Haliotis rufescens]|uniref:uncharacterized protein LOC125374503 n=1 Tax=Haliotis rufescens TaxID=6454 RepID=UPI00201F5743|nr:uncharacterized protein LOC125374503 [Haliotis rufescens]